jgi:hypothetical protein
MFASLLLLTIDDTSNLQQQESKVALEMGRQYGNARGD